MAKNAKQRPAQNKPYILPPESARILVDRLRRLGAPVTAKRGYDLRSVSSWSPQRWTALHRFADQLQDFVEETMPSTGGVALYVPGKRVRTAIAETYYRDAERPKWLKKNWEIVPKFGDDVDDLKLTVDAQGRLVYHTQKRRMFYLPLNDFMLATDPDGYIKSIVKDARKQGARVFVIKAGQHYFRVGRYNSGVFTQANEGVEMLEAMMAKYDNYNEWLHTLECHIVDDAEIERRRSASGAVHEMLREHEREREKHRKSTKAAFKRYQRMMARQRATAKAKAKPKKSRK